MFASKLTAFRLRSWLVGACLSVAASSVVVAQSPPKNFVMHEAPKQVPAIAFEDEQGRAQSLEMPALDRLQATLGGPEFEVVALSIDRSGIEAVRKFYAEVGVRNLALRIDSSGKAARELGAIGLPVTVLIDRRGREIGRLMGPAEWDEPGIVEFLKRVVAQKASATEVPVQVSSTGTATVLLNAMNQPGRTP
jgi:hypothetical protein